MRGQHRALIVVALLAVPLLGAGAPGLAEASQCPAGMRTLEGVGLVCPQPDGTFEVFSPALERLGFVHGTDPAPAGAPPEPEVADLASNVTCYDGVPGAYYVQAIYARAANDQDRYAALAPQVRDLVAGAQRLLNDAAARTGGHASLHVKCAGGVVEVKSEVLPTSAAAASFSTIVSDLRAKGYTDPRLKYWVFYDDPSACSCGGTGHIYTDDDPGAWNLNNGNAGSMFAVDYGYLSTRIWLHELGHNLGAVQNSAPHSTRALHCYESGDIMCYNDGGANGSLYGSVSCPGSEVFDCHNDDYYHADPPAGSYLATHWNLGSPVVRFLRRADNTPPAVPALECGGAGRIEKGAQLSCRLNVEDDSEGVRYRVDWGDGTPETLQPASGVVAPYQEVAALHAYAAPGAYIIRARAEDSEGAPGGEATLAIDVLDDLTPPTVRIVDPHKGALYTGCGAPLPFVATSIVWVNAGCVRAEVSDPSGIARVEVRFRGELRAVDDTAPYELEVEVPASAPGTLLLVEAVDGAGNRGAQVVAVDMLRIP